LSVYVRFLHFVQRTFKSAGAPSFLCSTLLTILKILVYTTATLYFQGTDQTMLAKLHKTHGSHRNYLKPKSDINTSFGLNHFAGVVFYDTRGEFHRGH
jgi:hypothetical protein